MSLVKQPDLGQIIFEQLANHVLGKNLHFPIGHPSTIYQLVLKQEPEIADKSAGLTIPKPLIVDWKLFSFKHYVDVSVLESIQEALKRQGRVPKSEPPSDKQL